VADGWLKRRLRWRKGAPPGIWRGRPHLYARWRHEGHVYVLVTVDRTYDFRDRSGQIVLTYSHAGEQPEGTTISGG
jgi:hypothetical protein